MLCTFLQDSIKATIKFIVSSESTYRVSSYKTSAIDLTTNFTKKYLSKFFSTPYFPSILTWKNFFVHHHFFQKVTRSMTYKLLCDKTNGTAGKSIHVSTRKTVSESVIIMRFQAETFCLFPFF